MIVSPPEPRVRRPGVYLLRFGTGRVYVGGALCIDARTAQHLRNLKRGSHHIPAVQAEYDRAGGVVEVKLRPLAVEDGFELQVIERVMIRTMVGRLGRDRVVNTRYDPSRIVSSSDLGADDVRNGGPLPLEPYE